MITPCVKQCSLRNGRCTGCKRTAAEIAQWAKMNDTDRKKIIDLLKERK